MERVRNLKDLLSQTYPVLTVSQMSNIAEECNISYSKVLSFVNTCREKHGIMREELHKFIRFYRPDLSNKL